MVLLLVLLLLALLLSPTGEAAKIIGGHEAKPHSSPYMAYLQIQTADKIMICGDFLMCEDFVLTAAHCQGSLCRSINVTLGAHNIMDRERTQQVIPVRRATPHTEYNEETGANDIMLLQLMRKANVTTAVSPISLPRDWDTVNPGMLCSVAGCGYLGVDMFCPNKLQEGDSGGPLMCNGMAQGIVSNGTEDGTTPHVYTRISSFLPWIQTAKTEYKWQGSD